MNQQLGDIQKDADFRIQTKVHEINQLSQEIAGLNEKIASVELTGAQANDERDPARRLGEAVGRQG